MTNEEKRIKIAEACGWKKCYAPGAIGLLVGIAPESYAKKNDPTHYLIDERKDWYELPDYFSDLNACREMRNTLPAGLRQAYMDQLHRVCAKYHRLATGDWLTIDATAEQHAEAFGLTLKLWT